MNANTNPTDATTYDSTNITRGDRVTVRYDSVHADEPQVVTGTVVTIREVDHEFGHTRVALSGDDENDEWGLSIADDTATLHKRLLVSDGHVGGRAKYKTSRNSTVDGVLGITVARGDLDRDETPFYVDDRVVLDDGTEGRVFRVRTNEETGAVDLDEDVPEGATVTSEGASKKAWSRTYEVVDVVDADGEHHYANALDEVTLAQDAEDEQGDDDRDEVEARIERANTTEPTVVVNDPDYETLVGVFEGLDVSAKDVFRVRGRPFSYVTERFRFAEDGSVGIYPAGSDERFGETLDGIDAVEWYGSLDDE
ncbi:hypothetical protein HrrHc1_095 [Halorubrum phage Hardycor1]|nr:hypothetical protein HrrHc1_095 [Halorubrum phage Hardycor1]